MFPNSANFFFRKSEIALLTKHKKEQLIAPIIEPFLGTKICPITEYDTDQLGTFTREIKRNGTQLETARKKAKIGMEIKNLKYGIGSEGSFTADPYTGFIAWNTEMVVFIDDINELEIVGIAHGPAKVLQKTAQTIDEAQEIISAFGFPENHIILRPDDENSKIIIKDISDWGELKNKFNYCLELSKNGCVYIENDLRSHANPSRQEIIKLATIDLLLKMHSYCPECNMPGYWLYGSKGGLQCEYCNFPTNVSKVLIYRCLKCGFTKEVNRPDKKYAEQVSCSFCNP